MIAVFTRLLKYMPVLGLMFTMSCSGGGGGGGDAAGPSGGSSSTVFKADKDDTQGDASQEAASRSQELQLFAKDKEGQGVTSKKFNQSFNIIFSSSRSSDILLSQSFDGTIPGFPKDKLEGSELSIDKTTIIRVIAKDNNKGVSKVLQFEFEFDDVPPDVTANPEENTETTEYSASMAVQLKSEEGARIYYALNEAGSYELFDSTNPILLVKDAVLKIKAVDSVGNESAIFTKRYFIKKPMLVAPEVMPKGKRQKNNFDNIKIEASDVGTIFYTLDGSNPKDNLESRKQFEAGDTLKLSAEEGQQKELLLRYFVQNNYRQKSKVIDEHYVVDKKAPDAPIPLIKPGIYHEVLDLKFKKPKDPNARIICTSHVNQSVYLTNDPSKPMIINPKLLLLGYASDTQWRFTNCSETVTQKLPANIPLVKEVYAIDNLGNISKPSLFGYYIDTFIPKVSVYRDSQLFKPGQTVEVKFNPKKEYASQTYIYDIASDKIIADSKNEFKIYYTKGKEVTPDLTSQVWHQGDNPLKISDTTYLRYFVVDRLGQRSTDTYHESIYQMDVSGQDFWPTATVTRPGYHKTGAKIEFSNLNHKDINIYYILDSDEVPDENSEKYTGPIELPEGETTLKYRLIYENVKTRVQAVNYIVDSDPPEIDLDPPSGSIFRDSRHIEAVNPSELFIKTCFRNNSDHDFSCMPYFNGKFGTYVGESVLEGEKKVVKLEYYLQDKAGNMTGSSENPLVASYTIDREPPKVVCEPAGGYYNHPVEISCAAQGSDEKINVFYNVSGLSPLNRENRTEAVDGYFNLAQSASLRVVAFDEAGNFSKTLSDAYVIDEQKPIFSIQSKGGFVSSNIRENFSYDLKIEALDSLDPKEKLKIFFKLQPEDKYQKAVLRKNYHVGEYKVDEVRENGVVIEYINGRFEGDEQKLTLPVGNHLLSAYAEDQAGNKSDIISNLAINIVPGYDAPSCFSPSHKRGVVYSPAIPLILKSTHPNFKIKYTVEKGDLDSGVAFERVSLKDLANGEYRILCKVASEEGNDVSPFTGEGDYLTFKVTDVKAPKISISKPAGNYASIIQSLQFHSDQPNTQVYFTLDGSTPHMASSDTHAILLQEKSSAGGQNTYMNTMGRINKGTAENPIIDIVEPQINILGDVNLKYFSVIDDMRFPDYPFFETVSYHVDEKPIQIALTPEKNSIFLTASGYFSTMFNQYYCIRTNKKAKLRYNISFNNIFYSGDDLVIDDLGDKPTDDHCMKVDGYKVRDAYQKALIEGLKRDENSFEFKTFDIRVAAISEDGRKTAKIFSFKLVDNASPEVTLDIKNAGAGKTKFVFYSLNKPATIYYAKDLNSLRDLSAAKLLSTDSQKIEVGELIDFDSREGGFRSDKQNIAVTRSAGSSLKPIAFRGQKVIDFSEFSGVRHGFYFFIVGKGAHPVPSKEISPMVSTLIDLHKFNPQNETSHKYNHLKVGESYRELFRYNFIVDEVDRNFPVRKVAIPVD